MLPVRRQNRFPRGAEARALSSAHRGVVPLPDPKVGTFTQKLKDEAKKAYWTAVSMQYDWKRIFAFDDK